MWSCALAPVRNLCYFNEEQMFFYEGAEKAGIQTGEVIWSAKGKCPGLVIVNAHYDAYSYYSQKAFEMYCQYTDRVEPVGMDECWLDMTNISNTGDFQDTADEIRNRVKNELGLPTNHDVEIARVAMDLFRRSYKWDRE